MHTKLENCLFTGRVKIMEKENLKTFPIHFTAFLQDNREREREKTQSKNN